MDLAKLAPWNWFKKEDEEKRHVMPVKRASHSSDLPSSLHDIQLEFEHLFDSMRRGLSLESDKTPFFRANLFKPSLDVASDGKEYTIKVELPGMDVSDISIEQSENTLRIKGEKRQEIEEKDKDFYRIERSYGSFERVLDIPEDADSHNISSTYKDGVLSVSIPRKALPQKESKKIEIKTES